MNEEKYQEFLKTAPEDHFSKDFKLFLMNNNKVVYFDDDWLVVENKKYWTPENDWLTAFCVKQDRDNMLIGIVRLKDLLENFPESKKRELLIKAPNKRSVKLFHIHLVKKQ